MAVNTLLVDGVISPLLASFIARMTGLLAWANVFDCQVNMCIYESMFSVPRDCANLSHIVARWTVWLEHRTSSNQSDGGT